MNKILHHSGQQDVGEATVDRLSFLPKPLLHNILSYLPIRKVVQTCVLAKYWRNVWCSFPTLVFHVGIYIPVKFVDDVLFLRDGSDIQRFCLTFWDEKGDIGRINAWIMYAIRHNVQVLDIIGILWWEDYELTPHVFHCESLRELKMCSIKLNLPVSVWLPALKMLHLKDVFIDNEHLFEPLFSAIPSLETFILDNCQVECHQLTISAHQLKKLVMRGSLRNSIVISAPNLVSIELENLFAFPLTVRFDGKLICLSEAIIHVKLKSSLTLVHLIDTVKNARYLTLSAFILSSFCKGLRKDLVLLEWIRTPFNCLRRLMIGTCFVNDEIVFINHLLKHSPGVESIILTNTTWVFKYFSSGEQGEHYGTEKVWLKYNLACLKLVKFNGFRASENEVKMVKFILENAIVLEKLIIKIAAVDRWTEIDGQEMKSICRKLSTHPRSSSCTSVKICSPLLMYSPLHFVSPKVGQSYESLPL